MAKPRKGVVPPHLRPFLFKKRKRAGGAAPTAVTTMARRGRRRGRRGRSTSAAALPLIPTLIMTSPELAVAAKAAEELALGVAAGKVAENSLKRLRQLYGAATAGEIDPGTPGLKENVAAKVVGAVIHIVARKAGMRVRVSKRLTLF